MADANKILLRLSSTEVKDLSGWPDALVEDYLSITQALIDSAGSSVNSDYKQKKVVVFSGLVAGETTTVVHGLDISKVIQVGVVMNTGNYLVFPKDVIDTLYYDFKITSGEAQVTTGPLATTVLGLACSFFFTYEPPI